MEMKKKYIDWKSTCAKCIKPISPSRRKIVEDDERIEWRRYVDFERYPEPEEWESYGACDHLVHTECKKNMAPKGYAPHRYRKCNICKIMVWNE